MQNTESQNLEIRYLKYDKRTGVFRFSFLKRIEDIYTLDVLVPMIINGFYRDINQQTNTRSGLFQISILYKREEIFNTELLKNFDGFYIKPEGLTAVDKKELISYLSQLIFLFYDLTNLSYWKKYTNEFLEISENGNEGVDNDRKENLLDKELYLYKILGIKPLSYFLKNKNSKSLNKETESYCEMLGKVYAKGYETSQGFVILKGSEFNMTETKRLQISLIEQRKELLNKGIIIDNNGIGIFQEDYHFKNKIQATYIINGDKLNPDLVWRYQKIYN